MKARPNHKGHFLCIFFFPFSCQIVELDKRRNTNREAERALKKLDTKLGAVKMFGVFM